MELLFALAMVREANEKQASECQQIKSRVSNRTGNATLTFSEDLDQHFFFAYIESKLTQDLLTEHGNVLSGV